MYSWNNIKISVEGDKKIFIDGIKKYINAVYVHDYEGKCDIKATVCSSSQNGIPTLPADAHKVKSLVYNLDIEIRLDVYSYNTQLWYLYRDTAGIWLDYEKNELAVCLSDMPLNFEYANIQLFFLHPLGSLLENFGYFRLNCSCGTLGTRAILFAGQHGSGKTTSAFTLPTHGGTIVSEDLTFINKDEEGYHPSSLTKLVGLNLATVNNFFPELNQVHSAAFSDNVIYYFLEDINTTRQEDTSISVITLLNKTGKRTTGCSPSQSGEIMPLLFPSGIHSNIEANTGAKFVFIADMLDEIYKCKFFSGTDMSDFVKHITTVINLSN